MSSRLVEKWLGYEICTHSNNGNVSGKSGVFSVTTPTLKSVEYSCKRKKMLNKLSIKIVWENENEPLDFPYVMDIYRAPGRCVSRDIGLWSRCKEMTHVSDFAWSLEHEGTCLVFVCGEDPWSVDLVIYVLVEQEYELRLV